MTARSVEPKADVDILRALRRDRAARADAFYALFLGRAGPEAYAGALLLSELAASYVEDPDEIELSDG